MLQFGGSLEFKDPLFEGTFLKRYKRFFAEIKYQGETIVAHVPNTGSMKGLVESERPCRFTFVDDPKRTLKYTLQMLKDDDSWVGVNTHLPNAIVAEAFERKLVEHWAAFTDCRREVKISDESRIDLVLSNATSTHYVEVKNVTMAEKLRGAAQAGGTSAVATNRALFPDAKTERGRKHLNELASLVGKGHTAEMLFLVQRTDCVSFAPAEAIDAAYAKTLREVVAAGVKISVYPVDFSANGISLRPQKIKVDL